MADKMKPNRVSREESDDLFIATATEPLRRNKAKSSDLLPDAQKTLKKQQAEAIVAKAQEKKRKEEAKERKEVNRGRRGLPDGKGR